MTAFSFIYRGPGERCAIGGHELHCGETFQLEAKAGQWIDVRIEHSDDWYLVGAPLVAACNWDGFNVRRYE
jgi:predicted cupin superfamily sugar epimerase